MFVHSFLHPPNPMQHLLYKKAYKKPRKTRLFIFYAIETSHYKYGWANKTYPELAQAHKCIEQRLDMYRKTHNKEYLIDVANFAMLEFLYPSYQDAKYLPTDSDKSCGLADGISYKELMEGEQI